MNPGDTPEVVRQAGEKIALWRLRPDVMVRELFGVEPDPWQDEDLRAFPYLQRYAAQACKGPGKSTELAWMGWNFMLTRPHPNCAATSISGDNLRDGLWKELAKWYHRSPLLQAMFELTSERIYARGHKDTWFMAARTWSASANKEQQANALAGFHADYLLYLVDESGAIPDAVMAAVEAALATGIECKLAQAGNPTHLSGPLYRAATTQAALYTLPRGYRRVITADPDDPMRTPRVSLEWARDMIREHGRDNPWVMVNVLGRFPQASLNALLGPDDVDAVMGLHVPESAYGKAAKVLGVDVARFGDDVSVIIPRQGIAVFEPIRLRNADSLQGAGRVATKWNEWKADACFVDDTGGYGAGWIDQLRSLGKSPIPVGFSTKPNDPQFLNKRAEILWNMAKAIKEGTALPNSPMLRGELCALTYSFKGDKIVLASKDQIKAEIGRSPDECDALAVTYAQPVEPAWSLERAQLQQQLDVGAFARAIVERADHDRYSERYGERPDDGDRYSRNR
jgi:hypothetical protein